ncbi:MAG: fimT [Gammaproteobacteria bacterium]|jgi:type IV fimbrial biogenesis protein FimT|nr:fimT [Gammaproteobacteria bacterium]MCE3237146.1 fimT [Gammaproteobacteria bacterium]
MNADGFSLLEIVVVLTIMFIVFTIAIPSERIFLMNAKVDAMRLQLQRAIQLARSEAITRGEIITLCGSSDKNTCSNDWDDGYIILANTKLIYIFYGTPDLGWLHWRAFSSHQSQQLQYLPSGMSNVENGTFWYCLPKEKTPRWAIVISQSGRARQVDFGKENRSTSGNNLLRC